MPVYDMIEHLMLKRGVKLGFFGRFLYRTTYVGCELSQLSIMCLYLRCLSSIS